MNQNEIHFSITPETKIGALLDQFPQLNPQDIYELITPFIPAPLMDMAKKMNVQMWVSIEKDEVIKTYFYLPPKME